MAKDKVKDLNDGLNLVASAQSTAKTLNEKQQYKAPSATKWLDRILTRLDNLRENEQKGRNLVLDFYNGKINTRDPGLIDDHNELIDNAVYPLMKSYVDTLKPNLFFRNPAWKVVSRRDDDRFPKVETSLLEYTSNETGLEEEIKAVTHEGIMYGTGALLYDFDTDRSIARARQINLEDVIVDNPDSWRLRDQTWIAVRGRLNLEDAKIYFNDDTLTADVERDWVTNPEFRTKDRESIEKDEREEVFEYWQIFAKYGQDRVTYYVSPSKRDEFLKFEVYDEKKDAEDEEHPFSWVKESPWAFVMDKEDFPLEFLMLSERTDRFYGQNELAQFSGLILDLNIHYQAMNKRARLSAPAKLLVDDSADEDQLKALMSGEDYDAMRITRRKGERLSDLFAVVEFPGVSEDELQYFALVKRLFDESSGLTELIRGGGGTGRKTATQANIESEQAGLRIASKQSRIDKFLVQVGRKLRMINAQKTPSDVVADVVNDEALKTGILVANEAGITEWDERKKDPGKIIKESTVDVDINSARRRSSSENIGIMSNLLAQISQLVDPVTGQPIIDGVFQVAWARALAKYAQLDDIDQLIPRVEDMQARQLQAQEAQAKTLEEEKRQTAEMAQREENQKMEEEAGQEANAKNEVIKRVQETVGIEQALGL